MRYAPQVLQEEPQFRLLFSSQVLSIVGDRVAGVALPFAVLAAGGDLLDVAMVSAAQFGPFLLLALPAGVWADRWDRRRILIASDAVRLLCQAVAATLLIAGVATPGRLVATAAMFGAADAFFAPAFAGLLPSTVAAGNVQYANALRGLTYSAGNAVGPALAGLLIAAVSPGGALAFDAVTFAVSLALLTRLRATSPSAAWPSSVGEAGRSQPSAERFLSGLKDGWTEVVTRPWVWRFLVAMSTYHLVVLPAVFVLGPVLIGGEFEGATSWAVVTTVFGLGSLVGDAIFFHIRPRHALRVAAVLLAGASCQALVLGLEVQLWAIATLMGVCGICMTGAFTLWTTSLGEHIPLKALSRVSSYDFFLTAGAIPLGNLAVGIVAPVIGVRLTLLCMTLIGAAVVLAVAGSCSVRALPRADSRHPADASV